MSIIESLKNNCTAHLYKTAIICSNKTQTFESLLKEIEFISQKIIHLQCSNTYVGVLLNNSFEFIHSFFASLNSKVVPVIFNPTWSLSQFSEILSLYPVDVVITSPELAKTYNKILLKYIDSIVTDKELIFLSRKEKTFWNITPNFESELSPLFIGFTSGTTSLPKCFLQSHQAWEKSLAASMIELETNKDSTVIAPGPIYHGLTLYAVIEALTVGATTIIDQKISSNLSTLLKNHNPISLIMAPTILNKFYDTLIDKGGKFHNVKQVITSGSKLSQKTTANTFRIFPSTTIYEYYGVSELGFISIKKIINGGNSDDNSVGKPFLNVSVEIRDTDDNALPLGNTGTIWVKSPYISFGYIGQHNQPGFRKKGSWATVGDQGHISKDGNVHIVGREGEMIITGGLNVYPSEVEIALKKCKNIKEACVVGLLDDYWGNIICAILSWSDNNTKLTKNELTEFCKNHLSRYKCPKKFFELEKFPLTTSGKILKSSLTDLILQGNLLEI